MTNAHAAAHEPHDHTKTYLIVFGSLLALTLVTVGVSKLHLPNRALAIGIGLAIALLKGSLVAGYFMHLVSERTIIRSILAVSVAALLFLILLPWFDFMGTVGTAPEAPAAVEGAPAQPGAPHDHSSH